jgi:hypothetical protein
MFRRPVVQCWTTGPRLFRLLFFSRALPVRHWAPCPKVLDRGSDYPTSVRLHGELTYPWTSGLGPPPEPEGFVSYLQAERSDAMRRVERRVGWWVSKVSRAQDKSVLALQEARQNCQGGGSVRGRLGHRQRRNQQVRKTSGSPGSERSWKIPITGLFASLSNPNTHPAGGWPSYATIRVAKADFGQMHGKPGRFNVYTGFRRALHSGPMG